MTTTSYGSPSPASRSRAGAASDPAATIADLLRKIGRRYNLPVRVFGPGDIRDALLEVFQEDWPRALATVWADRLVPIDVGTKRIAYRAMHDPRFLSVIESPVVDPSGSDDPAWDSLVGLTRDAVTAEEAGTDWDIISAAAARSPLDQPSGHSLNRQVASVAEALVGVSSEAEAVALIRDTAKQFGLAVRVLDSGFVDAALRQGLAESGRALEVSAAFGLLGHSEAMWRAVVVTEVMADAEWPDVLVPAGLDAGGEGDPVRGAVIALALSLIEPLRQG